MRVTDWHRGTDSPNITGRFIEKAVEDIAETVRQGRKVLRNQVNCEIKSPGSADVFSRKMAPSTAPDLIARFPEAWAEFQEGEKAPLEGTPIEELPGLTPERAAAWGLAGIRTVEQFAACEEVVLNRLGAGASELHRTAGFMLAAAKTEKEEAVLEAAAKIVEAEKEEETDTGQTGGWRDMDDDGRRALAKSLGMDGRVKAPEKVTAFLEERM